MQWQCSHGQAEVKVSTELVLSSHPPSLSLYQLHAIASSAAAPLHERTVSPSIMSSYPPHIIQAGTNRLFGSPSSAIFVQFTFWMVSQRAATFCIDAASICLRPPNSPKISQAGDLGVVADSIHVNLKHALGYGTVTQNRRSFTIGRKYLSTLPPFFSSCYHSFNSLWWRMFPHVFRTQVSLGSLNISNMNQEVGF